MIPTFSHCHDCGEAAVEITPLWGGDFVVWWCRYCRLVLLPPKD